MSETSQIQGCTQRLIKMYKFWKQTFTILPKNCVKAEKRKELLLWEGLGWLRSFKVADFVNLDPDYLIFVYLTTEIQSCRKPCPSHHKMGLFILWPN